MMTHNALPKITGSAASSPINAFNVLRAFICLQIMAMHFYRLSSINQMNIGCKSLWEFFFSTLYVGSESFFVIAGFFLAYGFRPGDCRHLSISAFFVRRFLRLILPFWTILALILLGRVVHYQLFGIGAPMAGDMVSLRQFLATAFCVQGLAGNGSFGLQFWFMSPLIQFLTLWGLAFWLTRKVYLHYQVEHYHAEALRTMVIVTVIAFSASLACNWCRMETRWFLASRAMFLCLGCFSYWATAGLLDRGALIGCCAAAMGAGVILGYPQSFSAGATALVIPQVLHWRGMPNYLPTRLLDRMGVLSFSIYLIHMNVGTHLLRLTALCAGEWSGTAAVGLYFLAIIVSVLAAWVFHVMIEKPTTNWMRRIEYRSEHAPALAQPDPQSRELGAGDTQVADCGPTGSAALLRLVGK